MRAVATKLVEVDAEKEKLENIKVKYNVFFFFLLMLLPLLIYQFVIIF